MGGFSRRPGRRAGVLIGYAIAVSMLVAAACAPPKEPPPPPPPPPRYGHRLVADRSQRGPDVVRCRHAVASRRCAVGRDTLSVRPRPGGGFFAVGKLGELPDPEHGLFGTEISEWTAPEPRGPWHYEGKIAQTSPVANQYTYGGRLEIGLPGTSPTVLYSINSFDDVTQNLSLYDVRFLAPNFPP